MPGVALGQPCQRALVPELMNMNPEIRLLRRDGLQLVPITGSRGGMTQYIRSTGPRDRPRRMGK